MIDKIYYLNEQDDNTEEENNKDKKNVRDNVYTSKKLEQKFINSYLTKYVFNIDLQNDLYATIQFPTLPTHFEMLMTKLDFPEKANKNPNDALFMDPQKIDATFADDLAKQLFNSKSFKDGSGLKSTLNPDAYDMQSNFESLSSVVQQKTFEYILEDTANGNGIDIEVKDNKRINTKMTQMTQDVINAITTYVRRSIDVIKPMLEVVAGNTAVKDVMRTLNTANSLGKDNVLNWIEAVSKIKKDYTEGLKNNQISAYRSQNDAIRDALKLYQCVCHSQSDFPAGINKEKYIRTIGDKIEKVKNKHSLDNLVRNCCQDFDSWDKFQKEFNNKGDKSFPIKLKKDIVTESISYERKKKLNEYDDSIISIEDEARQNDNTNIIINYDKMYYDMINLISGEIGDAIGPRENWLCFKNVREDMKKLRDRADAEIKKKIELVCKTGGQKSLIHWPFKAEGLLSMWERYASELDIRINNRINQLTGLGSVESGSATMLEDFLRSTYPQIISVMLTYKILFQQLNALYKKDFEPGYTLEDREEIARLSEDEFDNRIRVLLIQFGNQLNK